MIRQLVYGSNPSCDTINVTGFGAFLADHEGFTEHIGLLGELRVFEEHAQRCRCRGRS